MRALVWAVGVLALLWGAYWFVGARAFERGAAQWFEGQRAAGLDAGHAGLDVQGFPSRFDLTALEPRLYNPMTGYGWQAPFAQILSLSYRPWHVIAALPDAQTITTPEGTVSLASSKMQASLVLLPGLALALDRVTLVGTDITASSSTGWILAAGEVRLATRRDPARPTAHQIGLQVIGAVPDPALMAALGPTSPLPGLIDTLRMDGLATFSAPLDRHAQAAGAHLAELEITDARLKWGGFVLSASGQLVADAEGRAEGRLTLVVENWRQILPALVASGALKPELAPTLENLGAALARTGPNPENLSLPLTFTRGFVSLGPVPLGAAPYFRPPALAEF